MATLRRGLTVVRVLFVALALTVGALILRLTLMPWLETSAPMLLFLLAVFASASLHGLLGGLLATGFGAVLIWIFLLEPTGSLAVERASDQLNVLLFCAVGSLIAVGGGAFGETRERLRREIEARNAALAERDRWLERERRALLAAETMARLRDEFLATVSHELRTPVNAILGYAVLLRQRFGGHDAKLAHGLEVIERNARAQSHLIDDMLDLGRAITGQMQLHEEILDLRAPVRQVLESIRLSAQAKQVELEADLDDAAVEVRGDPSRLAQVTWNLLSNALKFTPRGGRVRISVKRAGGSARLEVSDSGAGIDPAFLPHVFDRFRQEDSSSTRTHGGLGIGLAIVQQLVELHGGTVRAESDGRGHGARFSVELPIAAGATDERPANDPPLARSALAGARVLLVEDDEDSREMVREALAASGAEVDAADGAEPALELLQRRHYDVLISDLGMPGRDGCSLVRQLRATGSPHRAIPAIALSGFVRDEDRQASLEAGFDRHLGKPIDPGRLANEIASVLRRTGPLLAPAG